MPNKDDDQFWQDILPTVRAALVVDSGSDIYSDITEEYLRKLEWTSATPDHERTLVAGNIRAFAHNVMRVLLVTQKVQRTMYREERDEARAKITELERDKAALVEAGNDLARDVTKLSGIIRTFEERMGL